MTFFAHILLFLLNALRWLPVKLLQILIFLLMLPLVLSNLLFKNLIFFQRAQKHYRIACEAYQQNPKKYFLIQHAWGLAYAFAQLPATWLSADVKINTDLSKNLIQHLQENQKGTLIIAAHLSSFEMIPRAILKILEQHPDKKIYTLYKKPHIQYLNPLVQGLRKNLNSERYINVPANFAGVKVLFKALKEKHIIAMVVDQVPQAKAGIWVNWFGKPAYTSSLLYQLATKAAGQIFITNTSYCSLKSTWHVTTQSLDVTDDEQKSMETVSNALEKLIMKEPMQYLWGYNRYKNPN